MSGVTGSDDWTHMIAVTAPVLIFISTSSLEYDLQDYEVVESTEWDSLGPITARVRAQLDMLDLRKEVLLEVGGTLANDFGRTIDLSYVLVVEDGRSFDV